MANTYKLGPMARKLTSGEKCNVLFIGDSTASPINSPRWSQSIIKKWDLDWREQIIYTSQSSAPDEGFQTFSDPTSVVTAGNSLPDTTVVPDGFRCYNRSFTTNAANFSILHRLRATARQTFYRGDPWLNQALRWRLATLGTSDPLETIRRQDLHDGGSANATANLTNATLANGAWQALDHVVAANAATGKTYRELYLDTAFGIDETNKQYSIGAYALSVSGKTVGTQLASIAVGGYTVKDHLPTALGGDSTEYNDTERATKFDVMDSWPDIIVIQLGINMEADESASSTAIRTVWGGRMRDLMDWHVDLATANSKTPPQFILINPWATDSTEARRADIAFELREIADERDDAGVLDLYQQIADQLGTYDDWQATQLADGVHQSSTGVETFGEISWDMLVAAASTLQRPHSAAYILQHLLNRR